MRGFEFLAFFLVLCAIFGLCFDYNLTVYFGKDIPWYGDCLAGFFTAPLNVMAAVIGYVLEHCDVPTPIFCPST